jgi:hypothetical protein
MITDAIVVAILGVFGNLLIAIVPKIVDLKYGNGKLLEKVSKDLEEVKQDSKITSDMMYNVLDHMATNNNTGGMKKCLDDYNAYFRKI